MMKTCSRCGLCFEDHIPYCSVCGSPLSVAASPQGYAAPPVPSRKPPALAKSIVGLALSASGLECAIGAAIIQIYLSLCSGLLYAVDMVDTSTDNGLMLFNGFFNGYMLFWVIFLGGAALACALVGRSLAGQCAAVGNRSRVVSVTQILSRIAVIITVVALAISLIQFIGSLFGLTM